MRASRAIVSERSCAWASMRNPVKKREGKVHSSGNVPIGDEGSI